MHENRITKEQTAGRKVLRAVEKLLLPTRVVHVGNGLQKAQELFAQGGDIFFMTTHPSKTDEPREYAAIMASDEFKDAKIIVPNAWDQNTPFAKKLAQAAGIDLYPIVTQDAFDRGGSDGHPLRYGNIAFYRRVMDKNSSPKVVFLAPDAGRRPVLKAPETRAAEFLATAAKDNFAVVFMGIEINRARNYSLWGGENFFWPYTIRIGNAFTNEELLAELKNYWQTYSPANPRKSRPYQLLDSWIYETQFSKLVTPNYLPKTL